MCEDERCRHSMFCDCNEQCNPEELSEPEPIECDDEEGAIHDVENYLSHYEDHDEQ